MDDYGKELPDRQHCKVGDQLKVRFVDEYTYIDSRTGEEAEESTPGYRRYGYEEFVLLAEEFKKQTDSSAVINFLFDMKDRKSDLAMKTFMTNYTDTVQPDFNFESKQTYEEQFYGFRNVFLLMGGLLSFVIGIIGMLNFINAVVTSVISRKREFAVLQAVGMTGKQLKQMLVLEGCMYGGGAVLLALLLYLLLGILIPIFAYRSMNRQSVVDRIREV